MHPAAVAIPKHDPTWEVGKYGPIWPKTPACYGFTIIAKARQISHAATNSTESIAQIIAAPRIQLAVQSLK